MVEGTRMGAMRVKQIIFEQSSAGLLATFGDPRGRSGSYMVGGDFVINTSRFIGSRNLMIGGWGLVTGRDDLVGDRTAMGVIIDYPNDIWDLWVSCESGRPSTPPWGSYPVQASTWATWE
jgi:hypothetical protein